MTSPDQRRNGNLIGGAILIVLGVIALLERYTDISFRDVWPLLLIGFGAWLILRDRRVGNGPDRNLFDNDDRPTPPTNDPYDPNRPINQV